MHTNQPGRPRRRWWETVFGMDSPVNGQFTGTANPFGRDEAKPCGDQHKGHIGKQKGTRSDHGKPLSGTPSHSATSDQ